MLKTVRLWNCSKPVSGNDKPKFLRRHSSIFLYRSVILNESGKLEIFNDINIVKQAQYDIMIGIDKVETEKGYNNER